MQKTIKELKLNIFTKVIGILFLFLIFSFNFASAESVVYLKNSSGILVGKISYERTFLNEYIKINSFCAYKNFTEGIGCEYVDEASPLAGAGDNAVRLVSPQNLQNNSGIWGALGKLSGRVDGLFKAVTGQIPTPIIPQEIVQDIPASNIFSANQNPVANSVPVQNTQPTTQQPTQVVTNTTTNTVTEKPSIVYQVIERAVPGPAGRDGVNGINGKDGENGQSAGSSYSFPGTAQFNGPGPLNTVTSGGPASFTTVAGTDGSFTNITATNGTITTFNTTNMVASTATITVLNVGAINGTNLNFGALIVGTSNASSTYTQTLYASTTNASTTNTDSLVATNATLTSATSTNFFSTLLTALTGIFTNLIATAGNITTLFGNSSNFVISNASTTNATTSNAVTFNGTTGNIGTVNGGTGNFTNITATGTSNLTTVNSSTTNSSTTNAVTGNITNLITTSATFTNATVTNGFATNQAISNASVTTLTVGGVNVTTILSGISTVVNTQTLNASTSNSSTTNAVTGNITNLNTTSGTITNSTSTNGFFSNILSALTAIFTNLTATNATLTNATSTSFSVSTLLSALTAAFTNLTATNATLTNATATNLIASNFKLSGKEGWIYGDANGNLSGSSSPTVGYITATTSTSTFLGMNIGGNIIPLLDNTYDLGDPTHRFKSLYVSSTTIYIDNVGLSNNSGQLIWGGTGIFASTTVGSSSLGITNITGLTGTLATFTSATATNLYSTNFTSGLTNGFVWRGSSSNFNEATSSLFISNAGFVGIGNTTPSGNLAISQGALTGSAQGALVIDGTWNNAGSIFKGIDLNITNTAAHSNSTLFNLALGGVSVFKVKSDGDSIFTGNLGVTGTTTINGGLDVSSNKIINVALPTSGNDAANKSYVDGFIQGISYQAPVFNISTTTIGASTTGDRYIVGTGSSGSGCALNAIAQNTGIGTWSCYTPATGTTAYVDNGVDQSYNFNGTTWVSLGATINHSALIGLQGGTAGEYYHLNNTQYTAVNSVNAQLSQLQTTGTATQFVNLYLTGGLNITGAGAGATITNATFTNVYVSDNASITTALITNTLGVNSTITNSTSTNLYSTNFNTANFSATNLGGTNGTITNSTSTNSYISGILSSVLAYITTLWGTTANFQTINASTTNATTSNSTFLTTGNATLTNATSSTLYISSFLNSVLATITTLWGTTSNFGISNASTTNASTTNFANAIGTNGTITNATTTNLYVSGNFTTASPATFTGTTTFATTTQASSTITNLNAQTVQITNLNTSYGTITNSSSTDFYSFRASITSATTTQFFSNKASITNATTTNLFSNIASTSNLYANIATIAQGIFASMFANSGYFTNLYASTTYATTTNTTNLSNTNATITNATITTLSLPGMAASSGINLLAVGTNGQVATTSVTNVATEGLLVYSAGTQSISNSSAAYLTDLTNVIKNDFGASSLSAGAFTVPSGKEGWYQLNSQWAPGVVNSNQTLMSINVNNVAKFYGGNSGSTGISDMVNAQGIIYLNAGDVVRVNVFQNTGGAALSISSFSSLSLARLNFNVYGNSGSSISPSFSVNKGGTNQAGIVAGSQKVTWSTKSFDTNNNFDTTLSRYTPTIAGKYLFTTAVESSAAVPATEAWHARIYKNGSSVCDGSASASGGGNGASSVATCVLDANGTTDYFEVFLLSSAANSVYGVVSATYFSGSRIDGGSGPWTQASSSFAYSAVSGIAIGTSTYQNANSLYIQNGLSIASSTPTGTTTNTLYAQGSSLYWNGSAVGTGVSSSVTSTSAEGLSVNSAGTQSIPTGANTTITDLTVVTQNDFGASSLSGGAFTVPSGKAGWYQINYISSLNANSNSTQFASIFVNGVQKSAGSESGIPSLGTKGVNASIATYLNAGDIVTVTAFHDTGSAVNTTTLTSLSLVRLNFNVYGNSGSSISPSFSVNKNGTNQAVVTNTSTLLTWSTEQFDTNNNFSANRYTPTVAGKYLFILKASNGNPTNTGYNGVLIRKNGVTEAVNYTPRSAVATTWAAETSIILDMNGTTDYVEGNVQTTDTLVDGGATLTHFSGSRIDGGSGPFTQASSSFAYSAVSSISIGSTANTTNSLFLANGLTLASSTASTTANTLYSENSILKWNGQTVATTTITGTEGQLMTFNSTGVASATSSIFLTTLGNFGIGTTTSTYKTAISNNGSQLLLENPSGQFTTLDFSNASVNKSSIFWDNTAPSLNLNTLSASPIIFSINSIEKARLDSTGNLFLNTASQISTAKLSIVFSGASESGIGLNDSGASGGSTFTRFLSAGSNIGSITNNANTGVLYNSTSDRRLKENFATSTTGLNDLLKLKVYNYNFISDASKSIQTGFVAQELYDIFPYAVSRTDDGVSDLSSTTNPWSVDYGRVTPLLVSALQELNAKVDNQGTDLNANLNSLASTTISTTSTSTDAVFANNFFANIYKKLITWLASADNGIGDFFAKNIYTDKLCIGKECLTESQIKQIKDHADIDGTLDLSSLGGSDESIGDTGTTTIIMGTTTDPIIATTTTIITATTSDPIVTPDPVSIPAEEPTTPNPIDELSVVPN